MFYLCFNLSKSIELIEGQFKPFVNENGKLPSFSICISKLKDTLIKNAGLLRNVGDYSFYKNKDERLVLRFRNSFLILSTDKQYAEVYVPDIDENEIHYEASYLLMQAYMFRLVDTGNFMIHSAAAAFDDCGILFCGLSGAGKSTQADLWKKYLKAEIINYDKPCVIFEDGNIYVHGSPWSGKENMRKNRYVPVKAIVYVEQAEENRALRLSAAEAYSLLYLHNYVFPFSKEIEDKYSDVINKTACGVPVYTLYCDISEQAVETLFNAIFDNKRYGERKKEIYLKYRINKDFSMNKIAGEYIVIPRGPKALDFKATLIFNETGAFLWKKMLTAVNEDYLVKVLSEEFGVDKETASADVKEFLRNMKENGLIDEVE